MDNVVITGSARGLGLAMAKEFRKNSYSVVLSDINEKKEESYTNMSSLVLFFKPSDKFSIIKDYFRVTSPLYI